MKYLKNKAIDKVKSKLGDSQFLLGLMKFKDCSLHLYIQHLFSSKCFYFSPLNISFKVALLVGENLLKWDDLVMRIAFVQMDDYGNSIKWSLPKLGSFTIYTINV